MKARGLGIPVGTVLSTTEFVNQFLGIFNATTVAHRGWPTRYPDNTLSGFLAASAVADAIELDVRRSWDGKLALSHDPDLVGMVVSETPWSVLSELDLGGGHHPVLLDEALAALPTTAVQIEIKNDPGEPGYEPDHRLALEAADRARPGDIVTSFNPETLEAVRRVYQLVPTGLAVEGVSPVDEHVRQCVDAGHLALVPDHLMLEQPLELARKEGVDVFPWTVNDPDRVRELVELGVSGIIVDDPQLTLTTLEGMT